MIKKRTRILSSMLAAAMLLTCAPNLSPGNKAKAVESSNLGNIKIYSASTDSELEQKAQVSGLSMCENLTKSISLDLWHYSGGYWGEGSNASDLKIDDDAFSKTEGGVADLKSALTIGTKTYSYPIDKGSTLDTQLRSGKEIFLNVTNNNPYVKMYDLYDMNTKTNAEGNLELTTNSSDNSLSQDGKFTAKVEYDSSSDTYKVVVSCKPKLNFYRDEDISFSSYNSILGGASYGLNLQKFIPIPKEGFGWNTLSLYDKSNNSDGVEKAAIVYVSGTHPYSTDNIKNGQVSPTWIRPYNAADKFGNDAGTENGGGLFYNSSKVPVLNDAGALTGAGTATMTVYRSGKSALLNQKLEDYTIGNGTLYRAGAIGVKMNFNITINAYVKETKKIRVLNTYVKATSIKNGEYTFEKYQDSTLTYATVNSATKTVEIPEEKDIDGKAALGVLNDVLVVKDADYSDLGDGSGVQWDSNTESVPKDMKHDKDIDVSSTNLQYANFNRTFFDPNTVVAFNQKAMDNINNWGKLSSGSSSMTVDQMLFYSYYQDFETNLTAYTDLYNNPGHLDEVEETSAKMYRYLLNMVYCLRQMHDIAKSDSSLLSLWADLVSTVGEDTYILFYDESYTSDEALGLTVDFDYMDSDAIPVPDTTEVTSSSYNAKLSNATYSRTNYNDSGVIQVIDNTTGESESVDVSSIAEGLIVVRYVVIPDQKQTNITEIYKNGVLQSTNVDTVSMSIDQSTGDTTISPNSDSSATFVSWATAKSDEEGDLLSAMPTGSQIAQSGSSQDDTISITDTSENLYVLWKVEINDAASASNIALTVPQWRLSDYTSNLGYFAYSYMNLNLRGDAGHASSYITPSGTYNYVTINPNNKQTSTSYNPANYKFASYLHSKAISTGSYSISHSHPYEAVSESGTLNLIKSSDVTGIRLASWLDTDKTSQSDFASLYDIDAATTGSVFSGNNVISNANTLKYGILNSNTYVHQYGKYYHTEDGCACYTLPQTIAPSSASYATANYTVNSTMNRYKTTNTDAKKLVSTASKTEANGVTKVSLPTSDVLKIFPSSVMLFENDAASSEMVNVVDDVSRLLPIIGWHTQTYQVYVTPKAAQGNSATDSKAKAKMAALGIGNLNCLYKGSPINLSYKLTNSAASTAAPTLTVKSYALDVVPTLKSAWGDSGYNAQDVHTDYLAKFNFAKATSNGNIIISSPNGGTGISYTGGIDSNGISYTRKSDTATSHTVEVRGGVLYLVDVQTPAQLQTSNTALYNALCGMKLIGNTQDETVFSTFVRNGGDTLTEAAFANGAKGARNGYDDDIAVGKGWYSEDFETWGSFFIVLQDFLPPLPYLL